MNLRKEIVHLTFCSIVVLGIMHFLTRPKVYTQTEYINVPEIEYVDREVEKIVEVPVEVIVEVPIITTKEEVNEEVAASNKQLEYDNIDELTFDEVFKMFREELGPDKTFYWRGTLYHTNWREEYGI